MKKIKIFFKKLFCRHHKLFYYFPSTHVWWEHNNENKGPHYKIKISGCLDCGKMRCEDYGDKE